MLVSARRLTTVEEVKYDVVPLDTNQENIRRQERRTESIENILARFRNVALADRETTRIVKLRQFESVEDL